MTMIGEILSNINDVPEDVRGAINFNGGGYDNHKLFWNNMKPNGGGEPGGPRSGPGRLLLRGRGTAPGAPPVPPRIGLLHGPPLASPLNSLQ